MNYKLLTKFFEDRHDNTQLYENNVHVAYFESEFKFKPIDSYNNLILAIKKILEELDEQLYHTMSMIHHIKFSGFYTYNQLDLILECISEALHISVNENDISIVTSLNNFLKIDHTGTSFETLHEGLLNSCKSHESSWYAAIECSACNGGLDLNKNLIYTTIMDDIDEGNDDDVLSIISERMKGIVEDNIKPNDADILFDQIFDMFMNDELHDAMRYCLINGYSYISYCRRKFDTLTNLRDEERKIIDFRIENGEY